MNKRKKIKYIKPNIGYFPELEPYFVHGFSWGEEAGNFAYTYGNRKENFQRNKEFFDELDIGPPRKAVLMVPQHQDKIVFVGEELISKRGHFSGINVKCDAVFTTLSDVTITVKIADCQTYYLYGETESDESVRGIVHSGWRGTNMMFSKKVIKNLIEQHQVKPASIIIGLVPGIFQKDRTIQDFSTIDGDVSHWGDYVYFEHGDYHLDSRNFSLHQLTESGVKEENIYLYDINTFDQAKKGNCFSQKLEYLEESEGNEIEKGRFIVAMRT